MRVSLGKAKVAGPILRDTASGEAALLRRLLFESYTLTATELKRKADNNESDGPKKLPVQEIATRFTALEKKLSPIKIESVLEPSHSLINSLAQCCDDGRLRYVEWAKCTSRTMELNNIKESRRQTLLESSNRQRPSRCYVVMLERSLKC